MKKSISILLLSLVSLSAYAQTCPEVSQVYSYNSKGNIVPVAPEGFMVAYAQDRSKPPTSFWYAAWASQRIDPRDEKRVLCIYGLSETSWWQIETANQVDKAQFSTRAEWKRFGSDDKDDYYRCEQRDNPMACVFN